jgi:hypothetical protein
LEGEGREKEGAREQEKESANEIEWCPKRTNRGRKRERQEERIREFSRDSVGFGRWGANKKQGGVRRERESDRKQAR